MLNKYKHLFPANGTSTNTHLGKYSSNELDLVVDHEESGTKMFVCCRYVLNDNPQVSRVLISSPDTDVTIISCYQYSVELNSQDEFWFRTGTRKYKRYIAIHAIARLLGHDICCLLPTFYTITGSDSISDFHGISKKSASSVLKNLSHELLELKEFGADAILSLDHDSVIAATRFVYMLYSKQYHVDINYFRHQLFTLKNLSGVKLPTTLGALCLHLQHANYQSH